MKHTTKELIRIYLTLAITTLLTIGIAYIGIKKEYKKVVIIKTK